MAVEENQEKEQSSEEKDSEEDGDEIEQEEEEREFFDMKIRTSQKKPKKGISKSQKNLLTWESSQINGAI